MAMHVRKGDTVKVLAGDDRGKTGEVLKVDYKKGKVLVQGINRVYKHMRPSRRHPQGGRIQKEMPISVSNVLPLDPKTQKSTRVRFTVNADGQKQRVAKKSGEVLGSLGKKSQ